MGNWCVTIAQPRAELKVLLNLRRQGYRAYCPMTREKLTRRGQTVLVERALFPRYLFVEIEDMWRSIMGTFGVSAVIMEGETPAMLDDDVISEIRRREDAAGFVVLPAAKARFKAGQRARIYSGLFAGRTAVIEGMTAPERVIVLMRLLGRETRVEIQADDLAVA